MDILYKDLEKVLLTEKQLQKRLVTLGQEITTYYSREKLAALTVICITNGSIIFTADLIRQIGLPLHMDSMRVSSYHGGSRPVSEPEIIANIRLSLKGQHVLVLDDILDTGHTLTKVKSALSTQQPASVKIGVLLDKKERREVPIEADFIGFDIPNEFVVGYGLDYQEKYRNLPCIGVLKPQLIG